MENTALGLEGRMCPHIEDSLLLKQNWPFTAKRRRNAPTIRIIEYVRTFTVRKESGECSGYDGYDMR
jgi:hypothetical protein